MNTFVEIKNKEAAWATINWQVSDWCNYRCSYCNEFHWGGKHKNNNNIDIMLANLETLIKLYKRNGIHYFKLAITGGEPSVWKGLIPLVSKFRELAGYDGHSVSLNTNLSRELEWWKTYHSHFDKIIASFHPELVNKEEYLEKYNYLQDKIDILARIMMHKDRFLECIDFANLIKQTCQNYHIEYAPVLSTLASDVSDYQYTDPQHMEFFKNHNNEQKIDSLITSPNKILTSAIDENGNSFKPNLQKIINEKQNNFYNWQCDIYKGIFISASGDISLATCRQGVKVGNIFQNDINFDFLNPIICKKEWCLCDTDINIPKRKIAVDKTS